MKLKNIDKIALIYKDQKITYKDIISTAIKLSSNLDLNNKKAAIFLENRPEWVYALFTIWKAKGEAVLIDVLSSKDELSYILEDSKPSIIFVSNKTISLVAEMKGIRIINVDEINAVNTKCDVDELDFSRDSTAVIIYTSGTTGSPKGVMLSFENLNTNINDMITRKILNKNDTILSLLFFHHSYPLMATLLVPLFVSAAIVIAEEISSDEIFKLLSKNKITVIVGVPRLFSLLAKGIIKQIKASRLSSFLFKLMSKIKSKFLRKLIFRKVQKKFGGKIKFFVSGGAKLDVEVAKALEILGFSIIEGYGLTETSPVIAFNSLDQNRVGTVGKHLDHVEVKIVDGELLVKGPSIMKGYYNKPEETAQVIKDGWFYTGDLAAIDEQGYITITGRKKEMIVLSNGKNIDPVAIENQILNATEFIKEIGVYEEDGTLSALIFPDFQLLSNKKILNITETIKWIIIDAYNASAPDYRKIQNYNIVNQELPKTRLGKIKRFMLADLVKQREVPQEDSPTDEVYRILSTHLAELSKKEIFPSSHIELDLALDSVDKADLQNFVEKTFGISLSSEKFAELLVLRDLYEFIKENKTLTKIKVDSSKIDVDLGKANKKLINLAQKILQPSFKMYFDLKINGLENFPKDTNFIIAPNHQSYLDAQILSSIVPLEIAVNTYGLAYYEAFQSKVMKEVAKNMNVISVDINKNLREVLEKLDLVLERKKNLLIFPEGGLTRDGKLLEFKPMFAILAQKKNIPIVPVTINGTIKALPIGSSIPKRAKIRIDFLPAEYPNEKGFEDLSLRVYNKIKEKLDESI